MGRPIVAITMGDAAGIGPEIIAKALADAELRSKARMLVIGDLRRMQLAMDIVSSPLAINKVAGPAEALFAEGTIDVLDVDCIPEDLKWGELSAAAGHGAYLFIEKAVQLAMAHEVDAICTGPLNKAALHAAGHKYPGHTELLASLTGTEEVSMMLTAPRMRVIHVTTHIGLIDAIAKINGDLVYRTIKRGHELLIASGIENPRIAVCAINPHAGEGGLFGYGEEEEKIQPGIEKAQAEGIDAFGPAARGHAVLPRRTWRLRPGGGAVPRPGARTGQGPGPGERRQYHRGIARRPDLRGPRHRLRYRREERGRPRVPAGGPAPGGGPGARAQRESIGDCKKATGSDS